MKLIIVLLMIGVAVSHGGEADTLVENLKRSQWMTHYEQMSSQNSKRSMTRNASPTSTANCKCLGPECHCCSSMPGGRRNVDGCFYAKMEENGMMHFKWTANGKPQFDERLDTNSCAEQPVCQTVPSSRGMSDCCVTLNSKTNEDGSMTSCPHIVMNVKGQSGAMADIECLHYADGEMNVGDRDDPSQPGTFTLKYKEPMKVAARRLMDDE